MADGYRYLLVLRHEGEILERQEASVAPAVEDALFGAVLGGDIPNDGLARPLTTPRWDDPGEPVVGALDVSFAAGVEGDEGDEGKGLAERGYDTALFAQRAEALTRRLVAEKRIAADAHVTWSIEAEPRPAPRFRSARTTRTPFPLTAAELPDVEAGAIEIHVHEDVLACLDRQIEAAPLVELAGLLAGRVLHDRDRGACAVEIARYFALPAGEGGSSGAHFDFGPQTFARMQRAVAGLEEGYTCTGWAHTHPACENCRSHPECPTQTVFFSEDDVAVHASSFREPFQVGLVAGKLANRPVTAPGFLVFGWRRAVVTGVSFRIARGAGDARTLSEPLTHAGLLEPIDAEIEEVGGEAGAILDGAPAALER